MGAVVDLDAVDEYVRLSLAYLVSVGSASGARHLAEPFDARRRHLDRLWYGFSLIEITLVGMRLERA